MKPVDSTSQLSLDFTPGLVERYGSLLECVRACVYTNPRPAKAIAMDMDVTPSDLARKLSGNPDDPRRFSIADLEAFIEATGDTTPILYLAQKYCADPEVRQQEALAELCKMVPSLQALLSAAGVPSDKGA